MRLPKCEFSKGFRSPRLLWGICAGVRGKNESAMEFGDKAGMGPAPDEAKLAVFQAYYDKLYAH